MKILYTDNFLHNLDSIEAYWRFNQFPQGFERLIDELETTVLDTLNQFPHVGRSFASRELLSVQATLKSQQLQELLVNQEIREYLMSDYLVLYLLQTDSHGATQALQLLSIKHHLQLSFDLQKFIY